MTTNRAHDPYNCTCHETCSLCLLPVPVTALREVDRPNHFIYEGALICTACRVSNQIHTREV